MDELESLFAVPGPENRNTAKTKGPFWIITLANSFTSDSTSANLDKIESAIQARSKKIVIRIPDVLEISPNDALRYHHALAKTPPEVDLVGEADSPLIASAVLVWLSTRRRYIRETAWVYITPPQPQGKPVAPFPWMDPGDAWQFEPPSGINFYHTDHATVWNFIGRYLPVKELGGKILTPAVLDEFSLLDPELMKRPALLPSGVKPGRAAAQTRRKAERASANLEYRTKGKPVWLIGRNSRGSYTLKGGFPWSMLQQDPTLRHKCLPLEFPTKRALLRHVDDSGYCGRHDQVVVDGMSIVRE